MKNIKPYTKYWDRLANVEARTFAPEIYPCATCGYPVVEGYCCPNCKSNNPRVEEKPNARLDRQEEAR